MIYTSRKQAELEVAYNKRHKPGTEWEVEEVRVPNAYGIMTTRYRPVKKEKSDG